MQQIYKRTHTPKCDFNKVDVFQHRCFPVNIVTFLRTPILQNIGGQLLMERKRLKA